MPSPVCDSPTLSLPPFVLNMSAEDDFLRVAHVVRADFSVPNAYEEFKNAVLGIGIDKHLILQLGNARGVQNQGLGALIDIHRAFDSAGKRIMLVALSPELHEVFKITRLDKFLTVRTNLEEARLALLNLR